MRTTRRKALALTVAAAAAGAAGPAFGQSLGQAQDGLRAALRAGADAAVATLGAPDGFFRSDRFRIPLPGPLARAQSTLRPWGMSGRLDDLELRVNRAAEAAMPAAGRLLRQAIDGLTISDAIGIVRGPSDAATRYLRERSEPSLRALLAPPMRDALESAGAFAAADRATRGMGGLLAAGSAQNLREEMVTFGVSRALDAAFTLIAEEERAIRANPLSRSSAILRRVFGGL